MKLYIADHLGCHKTTKEIEKWFERRGHEVRYSFYYDPALYEWCDVAFFAWAEGMVNLAIQDGWPKKKPTFVWAVDIEIWARQAVGMNWDDIAGLFYMSKDLFRYLDTEEQFDVKYPKLPIRHLPLSIDLNDWTFKERSHGTKIGVIGEMWMAKNPFMITQMLAMLPDTYTVDVLGKWNEGVWRWTEEQFWHEVREYGLEGRVTNLKELPWGTEKNVIDEWLEDKNYLVTFSGKDAFSIPVAEAMAKGIKALPHNFIGAKKVWGKYVWNTFPELLEEIQHGEYNSQEYRNYVETNYSNDNVLIKLEGVFNDAINLRQ